MQCMHVTSGTLWGAPFQTCGETPHLPFAPRDASGGGGDGGRRRRRPARGTPGQRLPATYPCARVCWAGTSLVWGGHARKKRRRNHVCDLQARVRDLLHRPQRPRHHLHGTCAETGPVAARRGATAAERKGAVVGGEACGQRPTCAGARREERRSGALFVVLRSVGRNAA